MSRWSLCFTGAVLAGLTILSTGSCCSIVRMADAVCKGDHLIVVGETQGVGFTVSLDPAKVSGSKKSRIVWISADPNRNLTVTFVGASPFPQLDCRGGSSACDSGPLDPNSVPARKGDPARRYTYQVGLSAATRSGSGSGAAPPAIDPDVMVDF